MNATESAAGSSRLRQFSALQHLLFHLLPGIPAVLLFLLLNSLLPSNRFPSFFILQICLFFVIIPAELGITAWISKREEGRIALRKTVKYREKLVWRQSLDIRPGI